MRNPKSPRTYLHLQLASALVLAVFSGCGMAAQNQNVQGTRLFQQGNYSGAIQKYQQAISTNPQNPDGYYNSAAIAHMMGMQSRDPNKLAQAEQLYNQCLNYDPNHVDAHRGLAVLLTDTSRSAEAFTLLKNWTITSPTSSDARVELARLYEEFGDARNAEANLQQALQMDVRNARAHAALGRIKEQTGDIQQAIMNYQRAYSLNPNQPQIAQRLMALSGQSQNLGNPAGGYNAGGLASIFGGGGNNNLSLPPSNQSATRPKADLRY